MLHELMLSSLVLANFIVPYFVVKQKLLSLSLTGSLLIVLCIIPIELLVIWLFLKFNRITINFYRLLIGVLLANIASSIIGIPFVYNNYIYNNYSSTGFVGVFLIVNFLISWLFESMIYIGFLQRRIPLFKIIQAAFAGNLVSYLMFAFVLLPFSIDSFPSFYYHYRQEKINYPLFSDKYKYAVKYFFENQQAFYYKHKRFANNWQELGEIEISIVNEFGNKPEELILREDIGGYQFPFIIEADVASLPLPASVLNNKPFDDYNATIFAISDRSEPSGLKFIKGICNTSKVMPKLVNGKFQCPPGFSDISDRFGLR
ncbi:MAG: hypothetical protein WBV73_18095 [Phormidium sp.]